VKFILDESVEYRLAGYLRAQGHDVTAIAHDYPGGLSDRDVLAIAQTEGRLLVTNDRDFGELIFRERLPSCGVILFRLLAATPERKMARLDVVLERHQADLDQFIVVTDRRVRVRRQGTG
jgi:predicted nuclease of predicted toxin-antitoxin system